MTRWELIEYSSHDPAYNMAFDEALFNSGETGFPATVVRLYGWSPPALSLGRHQPAPGMLPPAPVRVVRRITGGQAVFHDRELTYSVTFPRASGVLAGSLLDSYHLIADTLVRALRATGVDAVPSAPPLLRSRLDAQASCFAATGAFEIVAHGKKLVGSAQRRGRTIALQHGSILFDMDETLYSEMFPDVPSDTLTTLRRELGSTPPVTQLCSLLVDSFSRLFGAAPDISEHPEIERQAHVLSEKKHSTRQWILHGKSE
ncbi:lipoate--protein ligase family protein [bacterium]|nr:lipoate--protein ligase family protein [candidate division CSSED10-310 bacterium]